MRTNGRKGQMTNKTDALLENTNAPKNLRLSSKHTGLESTIQKVSFERQKAVILTAGDTYAR